MELGEMKNAATVWCICGYEASAVEDTFSTWSGFLGTVRATVFPNLT